MAVVQWLIALEVSPDIRQVFVMGSSSHKLPGVDATGAESLSNLVSKPAITPGTPRQRGQRPWVRRVFPPPEVAISGFAGPANHATPDKDHRYAGR